MEGKRRRGKEEKGADPLRVGLHPMFEILNNTLVLLCSYTSTTTNYADVAYDLLPDNMESSSQQ